MAVVIDREQCDACGSCVEVCATDALVLEGGVLTVLEDSCIDCNQCVDECPNGALSPAE